MDSTETDTAKGAAAKGSIFSSLGSVTEAIKSKLTHPTDVMEESRDQGGQRLLLCGEDRDQREGHTPWGRCAAALRSLTRCSVRLSMILVERGTRARWL
ncbi:hypothetical protein M0R45_037818 [Rubus argutus]|uniref:Uncharacterized protein n=1 Tax=Rubus argutus TaxID=59490 RepID=A0AAW1W0C1_RUBAR